MLKKTIKYTDFNGVERSEDCYFNLTKAELTEMEYGIVNGLSNKLQKIINSNDTPSLIKEFKEIIMKTYGVKSDDGRKFMKSPEILADFMATEAFSVLYMELAVDAKAAGEFVNGLMPNDLRNKIKETTI